MKKISLVVCCMLLLPSAAIAEEKTLYAICQDMVVLIETYTDCASGDIACTEEDALLLQTAAKKSLSDLRMLIRSGSMQSMLLSYGQARNLSEQASSVHRKLAHIEIFDALCNATIILMLSVFNVALELLSTISIALIYLGIFGLPLALLAVFFLVLAIVALLCCFVLMAPCLFWWI